MESVRRLLTAFPVEGDQLVGEWPLEGVSVAELRAMFDRPEDDPMYLEYRVLPRHVERLERAVGQPLDLDRFEYFVGARRTDS